MIKQWILVNLCLTVTGKWGQTPNAPTLMNNTFQHGLFYKPLREVVLTHSVWTIVVDYNIGAIDQTLRDAWSIYKTIQDKGKKFYSKTVNETEVAVERTLKQLDQEFQELQQSLANPGDAKREATKEKRSIFATIGHAFGIASTEDITNLQRHLKDAMMAEEELVMQSQFHSTVVKNLTGELSLQQTQLRHSVDVASALMNGLSKLADASVSPTHLQLLAYSSLADITNLLHYHMDTVRKVVNRLQERQFSEDLLHSQELRKVLIKIQQNLPDKMHLVMGIDQIEEYYRLPMANHMGSTNSVRAVLNIPLAEYGQWFHVYEVAPFPHTLLPGDSNPATPRVERVRWTGQPTIVAISADAEKFIDLGTWPSADCFGRSPLICTDLHAIATPDKDNCLFHLMTKRYQEEPQMKCLYEGVSSPKIVTKPIDDEMWAISVTKQTRVTSQCLIPGKPKAPLMVMPDLMIAEGEAILFVPRNCKAFFDGLQIPLRLQIKDAWVKRNLNLTGIGRIRATMTEVLKMEEDALTLQDLFKAGQAEIIGIRGEEARGAEDLRSLQKYLETPRHRELDLHYLGQHHTALYSMTTSMFILALIGIACLVWYKKRGWGRQRVRSNTMMLAPVGPGIRAPLYSANLES
jgi:hypothetical protein